MSKAPVRRCSAVLCYSAAHGGNGSAASALFLKAREISSSKVLAARPDLFSRSYNGKNMVLKLQDGSALVPVASSPRFASPWRPSGSRAFRPDLSSELCSELSTTSRGRQRSRPWARHRRAHWCPRARPWPVQFIVVIVPSLPRSNQKRSEGSAAKWGGCLAERSQEK